jgi:dTDP-glucose 4,6-dehydratase
MNGESRNLGAESPERGTETRREMTSGGRVATWLVTGGSGFIGSTFVRLVLAERPSVRVVNFDALTYAGNPANLASVEGEARYRFVHGNICDAAAVDAAIGDGVDAILNFAAETHVDRSILAPEEFLHTDILGTHVLLEAVRKHGVARFLQVSTDEVYGHVPSGESKESDPIAPRSPYAASKAGGDLQVLAYHTTYDTPVLVTRGSNTYGPYQYPEKLIPLFVTNLLDGQPVPVYGDGLQIRDWLHAEDHARGILHVLEHSRSGHVYNLGGGNPRTNLEITQRLLDACGHAFETHVRHVVDRPGHDRRYALDSSKARALGWAPRHDFERGLARTIAWYRENEAWWRPIKSGTFAAYYERQYAERRAP